MLVVLVIAILKLQLILSIHSSYTLLIALQITVNVQKKPHPLPNPINALQNTELKSNFRKEACAVCVTARQAVFAGWVVVEGWAGVLHCGYKCDDPRLAWSLLIHMAAQWGNRFHAQREFIVNAAVLQLKSTMGMKKKCVLCFWKDAGSNLNISMAF